VISLTQHVGDAIELPEGKATKKRKYFPSGDSAKKVVDANPSLEASAQSIYD